MDAQKIDRYELTQRLGGTVGVVYRALDTESGRPVALKLFPADFTISAAEREKIVEEAKRATAVGSPAIRTFIDIGTAPSGALYCINELLSGKTLKKRLGEGSQLSVDEVVTIAGAVADGLSAAHAHGLFHGDIRTVNIFLCDDGSIKILDFGISKLLARARLTRTGTTLGSIEYISPEQAQGLASDSRVDIWALGVVMYEMLTGTSPFIASNQAAVINNIINHSPRPVGDLRAGLPPLLAEIVAKALRKNPADRYQKIEDLKGNLDALDTSLDMATVAFRKPVFDTPTQKIEVIKPEPRPAAAATPEPVAAQTKATILAPPRRANDPLPWIAGAAIVIAGLLVLLNWQGIAGFFSALFAGGR
jgi:serine/threonine-protein kinase